MEPTSHWRAIPLLLALTILAGCTGNRAYRTIYEPCAASPPGIEEACSESSIQLALRDIQKPETPENLDYLLGFVEFDEQGQLFDRAQMNALIDRLVAEGAEHNLLMVVFVHGWKHNAREGDDNIRHFRSILTRLSEAERSYPVGGKPRTVVGIYVGWRGKSFHAGPLTNLTFWDRKSTAHKVGHGGVVDLFARLESVRLVDQKMDEGTQGGKTRLVIVGHSFGGAVVYSALGQILMERFIDLEGAASSPQPFSDLVILLNPAFEALRYATLQDMANERRTYFPGQKPILTILTSEADQATRKAFPLGRAFSTFWEKERDDEQEKANRKAVGHYRPFRTHTLRWAPYKKEGEAMKIQSAEIPGLLASITKSWDGEEPVPFPGSLLTRTGRSAPLNPYLVVYVDKRIIPGHNEIYGERLEEFLRHFILFSLKE